MGSQRSGRDVTASRLQPNCKWVCGLSELGCPCKQGPTEDGLCGRLAEALLNHESADNSDIDVGETCTPKPSYHSLRFSLRLQLAILTGCMLLICMLIPSREQIFVPGDLSRKHAQILENTLVSDRCSLCHPTSHADSAKTGLDRFLLASGSQDSLCMKCHQSHMPEAVRRLPHDVDFASLKKPNPWESMRSRLVSIQTNGSVDSTQPDATTSSEPNAASTHVSQTNCASCHMEHHGRMADLKAISDRRCQSCHQVQFTSFSLGHPEFKDYPEVRSRSILFSHASHKLDHFAKKNKDFDCATCHVQPGKLDGVGPIQRTKGFEQSCAECHKDAIRTASMEGWSVIALPSIEPTTAETNPAFADWPQSSRFGCEGTLSLPMRALLLADEAALSALSKLPASGRITDVIPAERESVTNELALATKSLVGEIAETGQIAWRRRLADATTRGLGRELTERERSLVERLCNGIQPDLFRQMDLGWFKSDSSGKVSLSESPASGKIDGTAMAADRTIGQQIDRAENAGLSHAARFVLARRDAPDGSRRSAFSLALGTEANARLTAYEPPSDADALLLESDPLLEPTDKPSNQDGSKKTSLPRIRGMEHVASGGWYIDQETLSLKFMPQGHADATLSAWYEWANMMEQSPAANLLGLTQTNSTRTNEGNLPPFAGASFGGCKQCHSLTNSSGSTNDWNAAWKVAARDTRLKPFTKFDHSPHLNLPALHDCRYCHQMKESTPSTLESVDSTNAPLTQTSPARSSNHFVATPANPYGTTIHPHMSEFLNINQTQCNACHRAGGANQGCTQCHNYHVNFPKP